MSAPTCLSCGVDLTDDNLGCDTDDLCLEHAPAGCYCHEGRVMRAEDAADKAIRYAIETEVCS